MSSEVEKGDLQLIQKMIMVQKYQPMHSSDALNFPGGSAVPVHRSCMTKN